MYSWDSVSATIPQQILAIYSKPVNLTENVLLLSYVGYLRDKVRKVRNGYVKLIIKKNNVSKEKPKR